MKKIFFISIDDMIKNKEFDKVCPQCKKGIEEGRCTSTDGGVCEI